jgi:hypothetical protein
LGSFGNTSLASFGDRHGQAGENEMVESKKNQPQMTQINADELKKFVKWSGIPSSSSASIGVICG